ncbi:hypothetical protein [Salinibacter altiplanensis]|uniref:hypothetical protein n=1 Tax=Salinibacter altiplanensis TaxID=1803181 RepID=UPI00131A52BF|nr:hypothetical protein [Salinibacter altiplanensis]
MSTQDRTLQPAASQLNASEPAASESATSEAPVRSSSSLLARKSDGENPHHVEPSREDANSSREDANSSREDADSSREDAESSGEAGRSVAWTEAETLSWLGIEDRHLPPGFTWSDREQAWVRDVSVDPMGKEGMRTADAEQLALLVDSFNSRVEAEVLKARLTDSGEQAG